MCRADKDERIQTYTILASGRTDDRRFIGRSGGHCSLLPRTLEYYRSSLSVSSGGGLLIGTVSFSFYAFHDFFTPVKAYWQ